MKTTLFLSLIFLFAQPYQDQKDITGVWELEENGTQIEIKQDEGILTGEVLKSEIDKAVGKTVIKDFKKDGDVWKGKFYVVRRDRLVDATIKEKGDDTLEMILNAGRGSKTILMKRAE